jgi:hypothetical protein
MQKDTIVEDLCRPNRKTKLLARRHSRISACTAPGQGPGFSLKDERARVASTDNDGAFA